MYVPHIIREEQVCKQHHQFFGSAKKDQIIEHSTFDFFSKKDLLWKAKPDRHTGGHDTFDPHVVFINFELPTASFMQIGVNMLEHDGVLSTLTVGHPGALCS